MAWLELERPSRTSKSLFLARTDKSIRQFIFQVQCSIIESCDGRKFQSAMKFKTADTYFINIFYTPLEIEIIGDFAEADDATKMHKL